MQQTDFREIPPGLQDGCGIQLDGLGQVKLFSKNFKISLLQIIRREMTVTLTFEKSAWMCAKT